MQRLLGEGGCPWDREQDMKSLRRYVLEEACEVIDAIDENDPAHVQEELGDLALQVVFLGELGRKQSAFGPDDVIRGIVSKLVRRHPHVFGDVEVSGSEEVLTNWEAIKSVENKDRGVLDGVPRSLPALYRAQRMSEKVSRVGFDWPDGRGSRDKVSEELAEVDEAIQGGDKLRIGQDGTRRLRACALRDIGLCHAFRVIDGDECHAVDLWRRDFLHARRLKQNQ